MNRIIFAGVLLLLIVASGCSAAGLLTNPTPTPTRVPPTQTPKPTVPPTATPIPTATPVPTTANPLDALTKAFRGWGNVKSFRAKVTTVAAPVKGTPGPTTESTLEMVVPGRIHYVSKQIEVIMIDKAVYLKVGTQWQKSTMPKGFDLSFADVKAYETELGLSTDVKFIGPEVLDGTPTLVYQYTTTIKTPTPTTHTRKVWIGVADGLPRKSESVTASGAKTTTIFTDYNSNITIEAPIK